MRRIDWKRLTIEMWRSATEIPHLKLRPRRRRSYFVVAPWPIVLMGSFCVMLVMSLYWTGIAFLVTAKVVAAIVFAILWGLSNVVPSHESRTRVKTQLG